MLYICVWFTIFLQVLRPYNHGGRSEIRPLGKAGPLIVRLWQQTRSVGTESKQEHSNILVGVVVLQILSILFVDDIPNSYPLDYCDYIVTILCHKSHIFHSFCGYLVVYSKFLSPCCWGFHFVDGSKNRKIHESQLRCLDTSGSMMGDRELLSKALVVECVRPNGLPMVGDLKNAWWLLYYCYGLSLFTGKCISFCWNYWTLSLLLVEC